MTSDFGFTFGESPKPSPAAIKINNNMIKVFGKEYRNAFISRCVTYYLYLRKEAKLFLNLVYLMLDSELVINPNTEVEWLTAENAQFARS